MKRKKPYIIKLKNGSRIRFIRECRKTADENRLIADLRVVKNHG